MEKMIELLVDGNMLFYKDNEFTEKEKMDLEQLVKNKIDPKLRKSDIENINNWFIEKVKEVLKIKLKPIEVSKILRG